MNSQSSGRSASVRTIGVEQLRSLKRLAVQYAENVVVAGNTRSFRERICCSQHPPQQRLPWLLLHGKYQEDVANVNALAGRSILLRRQVCAQLIKPETLTTRPPSGGRYPCLQSPYRIYVLKAPATGVLVTAAEQPGNDSWALLVLIPKRRKDAYGVKPPSRG